MRSYGYLIIFHLFTGYVALLVLDVLLYICEIKHEAILSSPFFLSMENVGVGSGIYSSIYNREYTFQARFMTRFTPKTIHNNNDNNVVGPGLGMYMPLLHHGESRTFVCTIDWIRIIKSWSNYQSGFAMGTPILISGDLHVCNILRSYVKHMEKLTFFSQWILFL